jgi:hypothetical protein
MNGPISITQKGSFDNTERYLRHLSQDDLYATLSKYGSIGVAALSNATPVRTGLTSQSWYYEIKDRKGYYSIVWHNSHVVSGRPIAIMLEYGHGTGTGGYVQGRDFIMPAIRPIFDQMAADAWKEVTKI